MKSEGSRNNLNVYEYFLGQFAAVEGTTGRGTRYMINHL